jgi:response regulator RpfG family c-di-GMP phosphodiesterase
MPDMNGKEVYERLESIRKGLKVLYMSGYAADVIVHRGIVDKEVHFIQKPLSIETLQGRFARSSIPPCALDISRDRRPTPDGRKPRV